MKSRFTEEQIIKILKEHESGKRAADIVREHNITEQTFYRWKSKYGGMEVNEAKRLKQLEEGNRRLNVRLEREDIHINHKRTYRPYREAGLVLNKHSKKKRYEKRGMPDRTITATNHRWPEVTRISPGRNFGAGHGDRDLVRRLVCFPILGPIHGTPPAGIQLLPLGDGHLGDKDTVDFPYGTNVVQAAPDPGG